MFHKITHVTSHWLFLHLLQFLIFTLRCPAELRCCAEPKPKDYFVTLIRLTCGPTGNFTIHANVALPALSSISLISTTTFNNNSKSTRVYAQTVTEWGVNESLYQSTELPCCLNGARDLKSIIFSHRISACYFPHSRIQLRTFIHSYTCYRPWQQSKDWSSKDHWDNLMGHHAKLCQL